MRVAKDYQIRASNQLASMSHALLTYEPGLGKTKIALDTLNSLTMHVLSECGCQGVSTPSVSFIVTKAGILDHWKSECLMEGIEPFLYHGKNRDKILNEFFDTLFSTSNMCLKSRVFIISYETLARDIEKITRVLFKIDFLAKRNKETLRSFLILDESHLIANSTSNKTWAIWKIAQYFTHHWLLTGTPIMNSVEDLFPTLTLLNLYHGRLSDFREEYMEIEQTILTRGGQSIALWKPQTNALTRLHTLLEPVTLCMSGLGISPQELKPRVNTIKIEFDESEALTLTMRTIVKQIKKAEYEEKLALITQWRLLSSAIIFNGTPTIRYRRIKERLVTGEPFLIITAFETIASQLQKMLEVDGIFSELISGKVSLPKRTTILKKLAEEKAPILIGVNQAIREGLNLPFINNILWIDTAWNDASENQMRDRIRRITSPFQFINEYYLVSNNSSEPWMASIRTRKKKLTDGIF